MRSLLTVLPGLVLCPGRDVLPGLGHQVPGVGVVGQQARDLGERLVEIAQRCLRADRRHSLGQVVAHFDPAPESIQVCQRIVHRVQQVQQAEEGVFVAADRCRAQQQECRRGMGDGTQRLILPVPVTVSSVVHPFGKPVSLVDDGEHSRLGRERSRSPSARPPPRSRAGNPPGTWRPVPASTARRSGQAR